MKKAGWIMTALLLAFLLPASVAPKLMSTQVALDPLVSIGWPTSYVIPLGILELVLLVLFTVPRTAALGAVLLTALFGGTVASHLRVGSPLPSHTLFGVYLGVFIWIALYLRDPALRAYVRGMLGR